MECQRCQNNRILLIASYSSDCNIISLNKITKQGYLPYIEDICDGNDTQIAICLDCGQVQGKFPKETPTELF